MPLSSERLGWLAEAESTIRSIVSLSALEETRHRYLGKNSALALELKQLKNLAPETRITIGASLNQAKTKLECLLKERRTFLTECLVSEQLQQETIDITLPGRGQAPGGKHPITATLEKIESFFVRQDYDLVEGPEIEDDVHNFAALNFACNHPARASHDTFYFPSGLLLRTHTSPVQIRVMESSAPPYRVIASGKVYRCDFDVTHSPMFHQVEGLVVDQGISFSHLKYVLQQFIYFFFGRKLSIRFRPSFFPFTEPSAEVDIECLICGGKGCRVCKETGWLETLGCGMVHPNVLKNSKVNPKTYTGFAFGLGVERFAMLAYGVDDLRLFFENDLRFLELFHAL